MRRQLSLYAAGDGVGDVEAVRRAVDPIQHGLIPAHVTLCRDDELDDLSSLQARLGCVPHGPLTLRFGRPEPFSGHGWLLRCTDGEDDFRRLRTYVLGAPDARPQRPHITLAHPRNPKAAGNSWDRVAQLPAVVELRFPSVCLIEQAEGAPWQVLARYDLLRTISGRR